MSNKLFRDHLILKIDATLTEFDNLGGVQHPYMKGMFREILLENLLKPLLPAGFEIGSGKIVDFEGNQSKEIDIVIYNKAILSPIMYSSRVGLFPKESCFYIIEIKSKLHRKELRQAIEVMKSVRMLKDSAQRNQRPPRYIHRFPITYVLFAFKNGLKLGLKSPFEICSEIDSYFKQNPALSVICIAGKGYWFVKREKGEWVWNPGSNSKNKHEEIIAFLGAIVDQLRACRHDESFPSISRYLSDFPRRDHIID